VTEAPLWTPLEALPGPRWIAHRGGGGLWPENTIEAFHGAMELNADAIELDVYRMVDGGLMVMHDGTADRTSNLSGIQSTTLSTPAALRGRIDAGTWFASSWPSDLRIPIFADVCADVGTRIPMIVHCNNSGSGALATAEIQRQGLSGSVLVMGWTDAELVDARAAGLPTCLLAPTGIPPESYDDLQAAGTAYLGVDYAQAAPETIQAAAAAGLRILAYTVNSRAHYAALPSDGSVWAVISDDPWYVRGTDPMRTKDLFSAGTFFHGMLAPPDLIDYRGCFVPGSPPWWGLDASGVTRPEIAANGGYGSLRHGYLGPLADAFTLQADCVMDVADYATASLAVVLTTNDAPYDDNPAGSSPLANGYSVLLRSNGTIDCYRITNGIPAGVGSAATAPLTLGATQHLKVQVTPTQVVVTRTNIPSPNSLTINDSTHRGGMYPHLAVRDTKSRWSNIAVS
jgi:Glycerophosphoryl diester phosphodiesterase